MTGPGGFSSGDVLTAAEMNALPAGLVGMQTATTGFSTSATHTTYQDNGMTLTISEVNGRVYRHSARLNPYPQGGLQGIHFRLLRNGVGVTDFYLSSALLDVVTAYAFFPVVYYTATSTASVVWKWQIRAATINTRVDDYADTTFFRQYAVEDVSA